jgi:aldose 1-epimerase
MIVRTDQPGVQLYTGNYLDGTLARNTDARMRSDVDDRRTVRQGGVGFGKHHGLCLETQHFPDAVNNPQFPSTVLRPGEEYRHVTEHEFGAE